MLVDIHQHGAPYIYSKYSGILFANNFKKRSFAPKNTPELLFKLLYKLRSSFSYLVIQTMFRNFKTSTYHVVAYHRFKIFAGNVVVFTFLIYPLTEYRVFSRNFQEESQGPLRFELGVPNKISVIESLFTP